MNLHLPKISLSPRDGLFSSLSILSVVLTICLIAITVAVVRQKTHDANYATRTITVSATGEAYAVPDVADFSFTVREEGKDVGVLQSTVSDRMNVVMDALTESGIAKKDIKTTSVSVNPKYEWQADRTCTNGYCPGGKNIQVGYTVENSVQVTVRDLASSGKVLALLSDAKVENLYGPNFTVEDTDSVKDTARTQAIEKARAKAKTMATAMGVKLGRVESFNEDGIYPVPMAYGGMMEKTMMATDVSVAPTVTPVLEPGQQKVTSTVSITYRIK